MVSGFGCAIRAISTKKNCQDWTNICVLLVRTHFTNDNEKKIHSQNTNDSLNLRENEKLLVRHVSQMFSQTVRRTSTIKHPETHTHKHRQSKQKNIILQTNIYSSIYSHNQIKKYPAAVKSPLTQHQRFEKHPSRRIFRSHSPTAVRAIQFIANKPSNIHPIREVWKSNK